MARGHVGYRRGCGRCGALFSPCKYIATCQCAMWLCGALRHRRLSRYAGSIRHKIIRCVILPLGRPAYLSFCLGQRILFGFALLCLDCEAGAGGLYPLLTLLAPLAYLIVMMCQLCRRRSSSRLLVPFRFRHTYLVVTVILLATSTATYVPPAAAAASAASPYPGTSASLPLASTIAIERKPRRAARERLRGRGRRLHPAATVTPFYSSPNRTIHPWAWKRAAAVGASSSFQPSHPKSHPC